jgi:hypothetical protein
VAPSAQFKPTVIERRRRLARQKPAGTVGDGAGNHDRHVDLALVASLDDGVDRRLGVKRVEDGFDQQHIGAAVEQALDLLAVGATQLVEGNGAKTGVRHVRRNRRRAVGRAQRAGDEAAAAVFLFRLARGLMRQRGAGDIELVGDALHAVIGLRDRGRGKGVGRDDVGAGAEILEMDFAHSIGPTQVEQVVIAAHLAVPGVEARAAIALLVELELLDHGAHGAVEHQNALSHRRKECRAGAGIRCVGHRGCYSLRRVPSPRWGEG